MNEKSNKQYSLDVIIINFNSTDFVIRCIESLTIFKPYDCSLNIFVFDNASQDNPGRIKKLFPEASIKLNKVNVGFGAAINQALTYCHAQYVVFLNPDAWVTDRFIETSIRCMEHDEKIGVMGPLISDESGGIQGSARAFPTPLTSLFGRNSPITKIFPNNSITRRNILTWRRDDKTPMDVDWVSGACMVVRREAMQAVGGFDKRFFLYWEDTDLCRRIREAGWRVVYYTEPRVIHSVGKSSKTRPVFANYQFHKSSYLLYSKYSRWPYSALLPAAGFALMLRFAVAVLFNYVHGTLERHRHKRNSQIEKPVPQHGRRKVLRILSRMNIGGPSIHVSLLTRRLNPKRFESKLVTGTISAGEGDMSYLMQGCNGAVLAIPELQREIDLRKDSRAFLKLFQTIIKEKPQIVHTHTAKAGTVGRLAAGCYQLFSGRRVTLVHTFHGNVLEGYFSPIKSKVFRGIERLLARFTDAIIAISPTQKWDLVEKHAITTAHKVHTINLGFDLSPFVGLGRRRTRLFRNVLGIGDDAILIGIIGRLVPIKNHRMFLEAAKLVLSRNDHLPIRLVVVGDGEMRSQLESYSADLGIRENVLFAGWVKDIPQIYADLDMVALTSVNEGTPVSVIEAMAASVPVVSTGVGGIKDLLGAIEAHQPLPNGFKICQRGILCPNDNAETFANGLQFLIDRHRKGNQERITSARSYVLENYSQDRLVQAIETLYDQLLAPCPIHP